jgi:hypothetical protein
MLDHLREDSDAPAAKQDRKSRAAGSRDFEVRAVTQWAPPSLLPDPNPEPGYTFRWVRVSTLNAPDAGNMSSKLREGWTVVKAVDHPEVQLMSDPNGRFPDGIEVGGLVLCKTPTELVEQRNRYYVGAAHQQMEAADNDYMRENDPRMPRFVERKTKVSRFGKGE